MTEQLSERYLRAKRALFDKVYENLNPEQRRAVFAVNHPLLILAGAGSGKTTVLVKRIAFIIRYGNAYESTYVPYGITEEQIATYERALALSCEEIEDILPEFISNPCPPWQMLAITFTNKAAGEIKSRLRASFEEESVANDIWAGTFHSICMRILRVHGTLLGYPKEFSIYDMDDSKKAIAAAMKKCNVDEKAFPIKSVMSAISHAKDKLLTPDDYATEAGVDYRLKQIARVYEEYQKQLLASGAMDFDDIIMQTVRLLREQPEVLQQYQRRFRYVCVDEFQDTNAAQLALTTLLSGGYRNLMVVGDDDQSIYRFRGATIENILSFDRLFSDARVIKLEQNYRSTQNILDAANAVIAHNEGRKGKRLWTAQSGGEKIRLVGLDDQNAEARYIVDEVNRRVAEGTAKFRDFAVLYRTNAQSNSIERAFAKSAVPYRMLGGVRFSDRKEIRDLVAYLQLVNNHNDRERLLRIINEPRRKIGDKTLEAVESIAAEQGLSMFEVMECAHQYVALQRAAATLYNFAHMINKLSREAADMELPALVDAVLDQTGYRQMLIDAGEEEKDRLENLEEFKSSVIEYCRNAEEPTLTGFLEENALVADVDRYDESADAVVMMTIHSAKGLEFPIVFLPGMEDGIFPGMQTITAGNAEMEEERRLAYVAITRAKRELLILHARTRLLYGSTAFNPISRFVSEIPEALIEEDSSRTAKPAYSGFAAAPHPQRRVGGGVGDPITVGKPLYGGKSAAGGGAVAGGGTFAAGDRVRHPFFGEGVILSTKGMASDTLLEVAFDRVGTKKLMATYAKLKKI
ncbi:MAG: UvrD-helicase domain-containing protein [Clostridia bacterium]|nr:UvrD-helicase domain-containing protein [Clostridia bacterium]